MSGHQEYKCPKCGKEWESLEEPNCPACSELAAPSGSATLPHVLKFGERMEAKLAKNRHKGDREGWLKCDVRFLIAALKDEVGEMEAAAWEGDANETANECADIANFAMMIADWFTMHAELPQSPNNKLSDSRREQP